MSSAHGPPARSGPIERVRALMARIRTILATAFLRFSPPEQNRLFFLTVAIGGVCGLAAVLFHLAIKAAEHQLIDRALGAPGGFWIPAVVLTPLLGGALVGAALQYIVPAARGSGIPQVKLAFAVKSGRMRLRDALGKFVLSSVQIGSGASLGREGPTVHICAAIASSLGRLVALSPRNARRLLPVGAAAGIAAAFNAPIAAVTFTIEEVVGDLDQTVLSGVVVASALAAVIERGVLGEHPIFEVPHAYNLNHASSLIVYALLGVSAGLVSHLFREGLIGLRGWFRSWRAVPPWAHPGVGGLVTGVLAAAAFGGLGATGLTGGGYETLSMALAGGLGVRLMLVLCAAKVVTTVTSYSSGGAGGIFAPSLFIGGMLGGSFGFIDRWALGHPDVDPGAFALVGMGAVFAGIIRAPMTSVLIIFEMTGGYGLVLPLMIANATSYVLARRLKPVPIYEALLEQDGFHLPHRDRAAQALSSLCVSDAMTTRALRTLLASRPIPSALTDIGGSTYSSFPVLDDSGRLVGVVSEARMRRHAVEGEARLVGHLLRPREYLRPDQPLAEAVVKMNELGVRQMAVVAEDDPTRLLGLLAMSDVMRAQARASMAAIGQDPRPPPPAESTPGILLPSHLPPTPPSSRSP